MFISDGSASSKSERTRARLREIALTSFRDRGYDATTMRLIAQEAGVSVGNAYYHFATKNDLVQELYLEVQRGHRAAAVPALVDADDLVDRIAIVYRTGLDQLTAYHEHAAEFLSAAVSPRSEINPLAEASGEARAITEGLFAEAVHGARSGTAPKDLAEALPTVLFLAHLLLALFWVYDRSEGQQRTRRLLDRGLALLRTTLPLARLPIVRGVVRELLELIAEAGR
ncbi:TetR/AcrR family transcriptional regulator [Microbacterium laevaniformans]|uniref:TetR/AcrR family transcriptional regulator n=1 Tax=Microbacterium laevaniformans TaxID=36807 RepID=A0A4S2D0Z0_9MICO|nr:TetR family transcriptional regulator [Microbacterium laevaniformans]TGY35107.1 TetR/AcrR family transcriptional regulator [Microbacterium laevaniformans]